MKQNLTSRRVVLDSLGKWCVQIKPYLSSKVYGFRGQAAGRRTPAEPVFQGVATMLFEQYFLTIERYNQDYFNRSIGFWTQTKPDAWAKQYLNLANEAIVLQSCEEKIQQYNALPTIQRLLHYWPMNRLKAYHAMLQLKEALHEVRDTPTKDNVMHLNKMFITARLQHDVFFWAYCSVRWLVGASNPWTTEKPSTRDNQHELQLSTDTLHAIAQVFEKTRNELNTYGCRRDNESLLIGELWKSNHDCADKIIGFTIDACQQAHLRATQNRDFHLLKNPNLSRALFEDKLIYYKALTLELNGYFVSFARHRKKKGDCSLILFALQSLLALIQDSFYLSQYIYSTNDLSAQQPLGCVWNIYNRLPEQLLTVIKINQHYPEWLSPWVTELQALSDHIQLLTELTKDYERCLVAYKKTREQINQLKPQSIPVTWQTLNQNFALLEEERQTAYCLGEDKQPFINRLEQFNNQLQLFIDNEGINLQDAQKKFELSSISSYFDHVVFLYHQSTNPLSNTYHAFFPSIAVDNPLSPQMEKEDQAYRRVQGQQATLSQLWQTAHSYSFSALDDERLKQQWQQLNEQLYQLGQQREAVYRQMLAWRSGNETSLLEQSMNALVSFRRDVEKKQSDYEADFEQSRQVLIYPDNNPLVYQDLKTLQLPNDKVTKKMLTQQYKNLSLKYHPDKHRFDELPPCDGLYLDSVTDKIDVLNYCARVCPDKAVYVFVKTTNHLFYANAKQHQIERVTSFDRTLLATLGLNQCPNLPVSLTKQQIELIAQQTQHSHRECFWQMQTHTLKEAFERLSTGEEGLTQEQQEQQEQAYKQAMEKTQREKQERTKAIQEFISNQKQFEEYFNQKITELEEELKMEIAKEFAQVKEQDAVYMAEKIANLEKETAKNYAESKQQLSDLQQKEGMLDRSSKQSESMYLEDDSSYETKSNQSRGGSGSFG